MTRGVATISKVGGNGMSSVIHVFSVNPCLIDILFLNHTFLLYDYIIIYKTKERKKERKKEEEREEKERKKERKRKKKERRKKERKKQQLVTGWLYP